MRAPTATYRLQLGDGVGFEDARRLVPYLDDLGVSDLYASPLLAARPGTSGYHVVDPTRLDQFCYLVRMSIAHRKLRDCRRPLRPYSAS